MITKLAREVRCQDVLEEFARNNDGMVFMTMTTPDVVGYHDIRARWRNVRHFICEKYKGIRYVQNYELHPGGHGWHIHAVFNRPINLRGGRLYKLRSYGFGMINIKRVTTLGVSLYLSKHCLKAYRGVRNELETQSKRLRLVNTSRGLPRLADYHWKSDHTDQVRAFFGSSDYQQAFKHLPFGAKWRYAELAVLFGWSISELSEKLMHSNAHGYL